MERETERMDVNRLSTGWCVSSLLKHCTQRNLEVECVFTSLPLQECWLPSLISLLL